MNPGVSRRDFCRALCMSGAGALIAGCATRPARTSSRPNQWSGRFSLTVQSEPPQSWSASFDLVGTPVKGELTLSSPLGSSLATVQWSPEGVVLIQSGQTRQFSSMDHLTSELGGGALPVVALFEWLGGRQAPDSGWDADLSRFDEGRILASRNAPLPVAELRLIIEP